MKHRITYTLTLDFEPEDDGEELNADDVEDVIVQLFDEWSEVSNVQIETQQIVVLR